MNYELNLLQVAGSPRLLSNLVQRKEHPTKLTQTAGVQARFEPETIHDLTGSENDLGY